MGVQLSFSLEDIRRNIKYYARFWVQILCVLVLVGMSSSSLMALCAFRGKMIHLNGFEEMYIVRDYTPDEVINNRFAQADIADRFRRFYRYLTETDDFTFYSYFERYMIIDDGKDVSKDVALVEGNYSQIIFADQNFIDLFGLVCIDGQLFDLTDYSMTHKYLPILLGYNYKSYYSVGDIVNKEYIVVGILTQSSFYLAPGKTGEVLYLDDSIVAPLVISETTPFSQYDSAITSGTIISESEEILTQVSLVASELEIYDEMAFISYSNQLDNIVKDKMLEVVLLMSISSVIVFFCIICIITSLLNYIEERQQELAIHALCGACVTDLILRINIPIVILFISAGCIASAICHGKESSWAIFGLSLVMILFISLFPTARLRTDNFSTILRGD